MDNSFGALMRESVITQSIITAIVVITDCALVIMARPIPPEMWTVTTLVVGFWFGSKSTASLLRGPGARAAQPAQARDN